MTNDWITIVAGATPTLAALAAWRKASQAERAARRVETKLEGNRR